MTITDKDQVFNKREAAKFLGVSPRTLDRMMQNRQIDFFKFGSGRGTVRFTKRALLDALNRDTTPAERNERKAGRTTKANR